DTAPKKPPAPAKASPASNLANPRARTERQPLRFGPMTADDASVRLASSCRQDRKDRNPHPKDLICIQALSPKGLTWVGAAGVGEGCCGPCRHGCQKQGASAESKSAVRERAAAPLPHPRRPDPRQSDDSSSPRTHTTATSCCSCGEYTTTVPRGSSVWAELTKIGASGASGPDVICQSVTEASAAATSAPPRVNRGCRHQLLRATTTGAGALRCVASSTPRTIAGQKADQSGSARLGLRVMVR